MSTLLLPRLAQQLLGQANVAVALGQMARGLMDDYLSSGISDADRAGEELLVVWTPQQTPGSYSIQLRGRDSGRIYCEISIDNLLVADPDFDVVGMLEVSTALLRVGVNGLKSGDGAQLLELVALAGLAPD